MRLWIDADACPREIKQIVFRASDRLELAVCLVANTALPTPRSDRVTAVVVPRGLDEADDYIAEAVAAEDVVITADSPLAARIVEKGAVAIDPRGELYTEHNVQERLSVRNLMDELRSSGLVQGGPSPFSPTDTRKFAAAFDRLLTKRLRRDP